MKLSRKLLTANKEHKGKFSGSKKTENYVEILLTDENFYRECISYPFYENMNLIQSIFIAKNIKAKFGKISSAELKPKAYGASYGGNNEPKCDIRITTTNGKIYNVSVKKDCAYSVTIGSKEDFLKVFGFFHDNIDDLLQGQINEAADYVGYTNGCTFKKIEGVKDHVDYIDKHVNRCSDKIEKYGLDTSILKLKLYHYYEEHMPEYFSFLHGAESAIQSLFKNISDNYPILALKLFHEFITGFKKFENGDGFANVIASPECLYELTRYDYDNECTKAMLHRCRACKKVGRLENVPRHTFSSKNLQLKDYDMLCKDFTRLQMSFKI